MTDFDPGGAAMLRDLTAAKLSVARDSLKKFDLITTDQAKQAHPEHGFTVAQILANLAQSYIVAVHHFMKAVGEDGHMMPATNEEYWLMELQGDQMPVELSLRITRVMQDLLDHYHLVMPEDKLQRVVTVGDERDLSALRILRQAIEYTEECAEQVRELLQEARTEMDLETEPDED
jgi:hypothetical protein